MKSKSLFMLVLMASVASAAGFAVAAPGAAPSAGAGINPAPSARASTSGTLAPPPAPTKPPTVFSEADRTRRSANVLTIADRSITVGELEDRLAELPRFQLAEFGATLPEIKRNFLEKVMLRDVLLELAADQKKVASTPLIASRLARARANATLREVRRQLGLGNRFSEADVKAYYDAHANDYNAPERISLWRISVATRAEAEAVLASAKKDPTVANFTTLAREKSLDKATSLRAGNLGFVAEDGVSNEAGLRVEPSLVRAAKAVKDGELVPQPVAEGTGFAVVWRRGTVAAVNRPLPTVENEIRVALARRAVDEATLKLVDSLKKTKLGVVDDELARTAELPSYLDAKLEAKTLKR